MEIVNVEALLMDNDELLVEGKTIGFVGEGDKSIDKKYIKKDIKVIIGAINEAIEFESSKDLSGGWTEEYRSGFVDGLKRALEIINE